MFIREDLVHCKYNICLVCVCTVSSLKLCGTINTLLSFYHLKASNILRCMIISLNVGDCTLTGVSWHSSFTLVGQWSYSQLYKPLESPLTCNCVKISGKNGNTLEALTLTYEVKLKSSSFRKVWIWMDLFHHTVV